MLDPSDPQIYQIPSDLMLAMTSIEDITGQISIEELDQYVGGVYMQVDNVYDSTNKQYKESVTFSLPMYCGELFPGSKEDKSNIMRGYSCP